MTSPPLSPSSLLTNTPPSPGLFLSLSLINPLTHSLLLELKRDELNLFYFVHFLARFFKMEDQKRALISRMLQYVLVHDVLKIPFPQIIINRTLEGKPYLVLFITITNSLFISHNLQILTVYKIYICLISFVE